MVVTQISTYFEMKNELAQAGLFMLHAGNYTKAVRLLIKSRDTNAIDLAIKAVGQAKNDAITHEVIDYLMGEVDGVPKVLLSITAHCTNDLNTIQDAKYIFKLYMALGQYKEAARTAIIIAKEEQGMGNYRAAHDLLLENYLQLRMHYGKIPAEIDRMLMIVHSYVLVKVYF